MPDKLPDPGQRGGAKKRRRLKSKKIAEVFTLLDKVPATSPVARLAVDQVRDACRETFAQLTTRMNRLAGEVVRAKKKRDQFYDRLVRLLGAATSGAVLLPRPPDRPAVEHEQLVQTLRDFKAHGFIELAQVLHEASGKSGVTAFQTFLVDTILVEGSQVVAEQLILHGRDLGSEEAQTRVQERLRDHIGKRVDQGLARTVGYRMPPEIGQQRDDLIARAITFLGDLLTTTPPARLLTPAPDSPFDAELHEPLAGRPSNGDVTVARMLFPGYVVLGEPEEVLEKASVYTERAGGK
jgi:hypothetical protein